MSRNSLRKRKLQKKGVESSAYKRFFCWTSILRFLYTVLVVSFLFWVLYILFFSRALAVDEISIIGTERISRDVIEREVFAFFPEKGLWESPRPHLIFANKHDLSAHLLETFPELSAVTIMRQFPNVLRIEVMEHVHIIVVCSVREGEYCVRLAEDGTVRSEADFSDVLFAHNPFLRVDVADVIPGEVGDRVFTPGQYKNLSYISRELPFTIGVQLAAPPFMTTLGSSHVQLQTDEGWDILLDIDDEPRLVLEILDAFLLQKSETTFRVELLEIDLRILDKIFYRQKSTIEQKKGEIPRVDSNEDV